ncbi:MAG: Gfo/Idh/MocA family oxidoreductase [Armatimonadetes bacterium]|nr:Gfo/Idh/MocA family oxidoreductase [Armatimonadota bacterium]
MQPARVAVIGLGRMAGTIDDEVVGYPAITLPYSIAGACAASARLELAAGCDLLPEKRDAFGRRWGVAALYDDWRRMLAAEQPDIVAICTRADNHAELAVGAAELGARAIYCEKAIACSMIEADAVLQAVASRSLPFNTGCLRRHDNRYEQLRDLVTEGAVGRPQAAVHYAPSSLMHGHIHSIDTLLYLLGDPKVARVRGELRPRDLDLTSNRLDADPSAVYELETDTGVYATTVAAGSWEFEVIGSEGSVRTYANGAEAGRRRSVPAGERFTTTVAAPLEPLVPASATLRLMEDLANALAEGRPSREGVERAHHATEACLAVAESHRRGGEWVELPLGNRELYVWHV